MLTVDVLVIGGGPAGLAAAIAAHQNGAQVLLIEREARLGGILKQCIHDGFGLVRYGEKLSGPEYAGRFIDEFHALGLQARTLTFVTRIQKTVEGFAVTLVNRDGVETVAAQALVLAPGRVSPPGEDCQAGLHPWHPPGRGLYCRVCPAFYQPAGSTAHPEVCHPRQRGYRSYHGPPPYAGGRPGAWRL